MTRIDANGEEGVTVKIVKGGQGKTCKDVEGSGSACFYCVLIAVALAVCYACMLIVGM